MRFNFDLHDLSASSTLDKECAEHENCKHSMRKEPGVSKMQSSPEEWMTDDQWKQPAGYEAGDGEQK